MVQTDTHAHGDFGVPSSSSDPLVGRLLDNRYRIGARIARGGMASVYEATDIRLHRPVAVKVMHPGLGDSDEFADRFVREARSAARLDHPNVVKIHDQGTDDGTVFLAMELVVGHTLRDTINAESPMPPARALALIEPVLSALATAHRAGLIHRDIKPENVLVADDATSGAGRVKVADFGLAKAISAETQHTATGGVLIGTVSYLAPELVTSGRADARADVYAAGVLLFELLTGRKPHEGETPIQVAYKHVHEDVPAPSSLVPDIPAYVDALVARATCRDLEQRPSDASVLLRHVHRVAHAVASGVGEDADLTADLTPRPGGGPADGVSGATLPLRVPTDTTPQHFPVPAAAAPPTRTMQVSRTTPPEPTSPPARPRRRRRGLVLLLATLLVAGAIGAGAWWFGWARYTSTPAVVSLQSAAAVELLEDAGLEVELGDPAYSESVPAGEVISSEPSGGSRILGGDTVTLVVSQGKERYQLPRLRELTEDAAKQQISDLKLSFGSSTTRFSEKIPEGQVISSAPAAGASLAPGTNVNLVVSSGRRPIKVGSWVGKDADEARQALTDRGLEVDISAEEYSDDVAEGLVISHDPPRGTLYRGETVSLVVSRGPELVEVPQVRAKGEDAAIRELEDLGFKVEVKESSSYIGLRFVFSIDPGAGEMIAKGSTVTIYLV